MENESKIVCRKCKGPHLTIKCGKETENKVESQIKIIQKEYNGEKKEYNGEKREYNGEKKEYNGEKREYNREKREYNGEKREFRKYGKVKMGSLPNDITEEEILELLSEWGNVARLKVLNYPENSNAYIDFRTEEQADYFVKAFDKTPCNHILLTVEKLLE
jgi:RNA recognition motif-containing protein